MGDRYAEHLIADPALKDRLREMLVRLYFVNRPPGYLETPTGQKDLEEHVCSRYNTCVAHYVPWVAKRTDLTAADVVEIGTGTGSTAAAFSHFVGRVDAYEINPHPLHAARERLRMLGVSNVDLHLVEPSSMPVVLRERHCGQADLVLMEAVLEHMKIEERLAALTAAWDALKPGGLLVVCDTPNRLVYVHGHTTGVPFFDMLPEELALRWYKKSPRPAFVSAMSEALQESWDSALDKWERWGRGVSFHEFEIALGDLSGLVVGDGYESEIASLRGVSCQERLLYSFFVHSGLDVPAGFCRGSLDVILRKPGGGAPQPACVPRAEADISGLQGGLREELHWLRTVEWLRRHRVLRVPLSLLADVAAAGVRCLRRLRRRASEHRAQGAETRQPR